MSNQCEALHRFLSKGKPITVLTAVKRLGIMALSQRVGELKRQGIPIESAFVKTKSGKRIKSYWL